MKNALRLIAVLALFLCLALVACDMGTLGGDPTDTNTQAGTQSGKQTDAPSNNRPDGPSEDGTWDTSSQSGNRPPEQSGNAPETEQPTEPVTAPPSVIGPGGGFVPIYPSATESETAPPVDPGTQPEQPTEPAPHEHSFGEWKTVREATCTENGEQRRYCACGEYQSQSISMVDHVLGEVIEEVIYAPDCWSSGKSYNVTYCATCGMELGRETVWVDALGHTEVIDPAIEATCTTDGKTEGSHCSVCNQTLTWQETIPATGVHVYVDEVCKYCSAKIVYSEGLIFTSNGDGTCYVSGMGSCTDADIVIPKVSPDGDIVTRIGEYAFNVHYSVSSVSIPDTVTEISARAFYRAFSLSSVNIPDGVTSIGNEAFGDTGITSIVIPDSVTFIGDGAFEGCDDLESVTLPDGIVSIGNQVFKTCVELKSITIPDSVTSIGEEAFYNCYGLTEIIIPANVTSIGAHAFSLCGNLESMTVAKGNPVYHSAGNCIIETKSKTLVVGCNFSVIPTDGSVTSIGDYAFYHCTGLTEIVLPDGLTSIGAAAFDGCKYLSGITIPDSVTSIGESAFASCHKFKEVIIPDNVKSIGADAFRDCYSMERVTIGKGVTSIGEYAFYECDDLIGVYIKDIAAWCTISFGDNVGANPLEEAGNLYLNGELVTDLVIPDGTPYISDCAFYECTCLTSVTIPGSVTSIGEYAFDSCTGLISVTIENGVKSIGKGAFSYCSELSEISLPDSLTSISDNNIVNCCPALKYNEYRGAKYLGNAQNPYVVLVSLNDTTQATYTIHENTKFIYVNVFKNCKSLTSITLPNGLIGIGDSAFYGCVGLTEIVIPDSVVYISEEAFYECIGLINVTLGNGLKTIGNSAFYNCYNMESMTLPKGLTSIGSKAFYQCTSLKNINLPDTLTYIGEYAFYYCYNWSGEIVIPDGMTEIFPYAFSRTSITSVVIPDSVTSIGTRAFYECYGLESVTVGKGVTSIGSWAFHSCNRINHVYITDLAAWSTISFADEYSNPLRNARLYYNGELVTELVISDGVTSIGNYAFYNCKELVSVIIPEGVTSIGDYAFYQCGWLENVTMPEGLISIGNYAFYSCDWLKTVAIPDSVTCIGDYAFYETGLINVIIPDSVTSIGKGAFSRCGKITDIAIPGSVKTIGDSAFEGCYSLISVTLGNGVESIGKKAFRDCEALVSVNIPESVISIDDYAFAYCKKLASDIVIPDGVTVIHAYTFDGCSSIPRIVIGKNVTEIESFAFSGCNSWTGTVVIPAGVQTIGNHAFGNCRKLEYMIIENGDLVKIAHSDLGENFDFDRILFNRIYYGGTAEDWANISIDSINNSSAYYHTPLFNTSPYFYSATAPRDKGNYWYYDENGDIKIWNLEEISYKAEEYSEKFAHAAFGEATDSYSSQLLSQLQDDMWFQTKIMVWESLHLVTDTSWESKMISKKDTYKLVIYDLLVGEVGADVNPLAYMEEACDSYMYEFFKILNEVSDKGNALKDVENLESLKKLDPKDFDCEAFVKLSFGGAKGILAVFEEATDLYDALYVCAQYQVLSDMDAYFYEILMEIAGDYSLPRDLRDAARECASCYGNATEEMLQQVLVREFVTDKATDLWNKLEEKLWEKILTSAMPGADVIQLGLKGVMLLVNVSGFNMDAINEAYYVMEAAVGLENALRKVIRNGEPDYLRYEMVGESEYYMYAIDKYKTAVLLGYDYANALFKELQDGASASDQDKYALQMTEVSAQRQEKEKLYKDFDANVTAAFEAYY